MATVPARSLILTKSKIMQKLDEIHRKVEAEEKLKTQNEVALERERREF